MPCHKRPARATAAMPRRHAAMPPLRRCIVCAKHCGSAVARGRFAACSAAGAWVRRKRGTEDMHTKQMTATVLMAETMTGGRRNGLMFPGSSSCTCMACHAWHARHAWHVLAHGTWHAMQLQLRSLGIHAPAGDEGCQSE
eukprot:357902-Chlamydomonas_euryale.AAC.9